MKANYIPAMVMLSAGLIDCILGFSQGLSPLDFTVELLIVLIVFYLIGVVIKWFYMANFKEEEPEEEESENTEGSDEEASEGDAVEEESASTSEADQGEN